MVYESGNGYACRQSPHRRHAEKQSRGILRCFRLKFQQRFVGNVIQRLFNAHLLRSHAPHDGHRIASLNHGHKPHYRHRTHVDILGQRRHKPFYVAQQQLDAYLSPELIFRQQS